MRILVALVLTLAACRAERPPAPTKAETQQLDETEAMLDNLSANEAR